MTEENKEAHRKLSDAWDRLTAIVDEKLPIIKRKLAEQKQREEQEDG